MSSFGIRLFYFETGSENSSASFRRHTDALRVMSPQWMPQFPVFKSLFWLSPRNSILYNSVYLFVDYNLTCEEKV